MQQPGTMLRHSRSREVYFGKTSNDASLGKNRPALPSLPQYIQESRSELRKVTWPTREQTLQLTMAVIVMTLAIALFLGLADEILLKLVSRFTGIG